MQVHSSALDAFTVHSILLDILFTTALGLAHTALFQRNDHTVYFLGFRGFSCSSSKIAAVARACCRALCGSPGLPAACWACTQSCTQSFSQHWHPCPSNKQGAPCVPQHLWMSHPIAFCVLGGCQPCGVGVLLCDKVGAKPLKRTPEARPADGCGGHSLLTSSDHPGKSLGSC